MGIDQLVAANPDMFTGLYRLGEPRRMEVPIVFQVEDVKTVQSEGLQMLERHYQEIAQFKSVQKLDPDWEAYYRDERQGRLWVMTARSAGALVGYIVMFLTHDRHYRKMLRAVEDLHFILPEYRKGMVGYRMLAKAKQAMQ